MSTSESSNILSPQEWTLAGIFIVCSLLLPADLIRTFKPYGNTIIASLILILTFQNYFLKSLVIPKDIYTLAFFLFPLLNLISASWANNPSLAWNKTAMWFLLFAFYINMRSLDFEKFSQRFWKSFATIVFSINVLFVFYSFYVGAIKTGSSSFSLSFTSIKYSQSFFIVNGNYITSMFLIWLPINIYLVLQKNKLEKYLYAVLLFVSIFMILLYNSRSATIALVVILLLVILRQWKIHHSIKLAGFISLFFAFFIGFIYVGISDTENFLTQYNPLRTILVDTGDDRLAIWKNSLNLFLEHPILGVGSGNWIIDFQKFGVNEYANSANYLHGHNIYIETLSELGISGLILVVFMLLSPIYLYLKSNFRSSINFYLLLSIIGFCINNFFYGIIYETLHLLCLWTVVFSWFLNIRKNDVAIKNTFLLFPIMICSVLFLTYKGYAESKVRQHLRSRGENKVITNQYIKDVYFPSVYEFYSNRHLTAHVLEDPDGTPNNKIKQLNKILVKNPHDIKVMYKIAKHYESIGNFDEALKAHKQIILLDKRHFDSSISVVKIGIQTKYWNEFDIGAAIFLDYAIPHKEQYYGKWKTNEFAARRKIFWKKRLEYIREFRQLQKVREQIAKFNKINK